MAPARSGSVRQRGERWQARLQRADGSTTSATFPTRREAERWVKDQAAAGPAAPAASFAPTFAEWTKSWLAELSHLRPSTVARDRSAVRSQLVPAFGAQPIDTITAADVRRWVARLTADGLAPATVTRTLRVLGSCLQVAADDGLIPANPARGIRPPQAQRHEQRFLTPTEVAHLAGAIDSRYRGLVFLGAYGGLRIGEMVGLTVGSIDPLGATVKVFTQIVEVAGRQIPGPPKTQAGRRTVPVPRFVMDELVPHLAGKGPGDLVFTAPEGGTIRRTIWAARTWRPAVTAAGLDPLRIHDLRHTAVALWVAAGASPLELTKKAGHRSAVVILDRYGHLYQEGFQATTLRLEEIGQAAREANQPQSGTAPTKVLPAFVAAPAVALATSS